MKNYSEGIELLNMPWFESPFFNSYLSKLDLNESQLKIASDFNSKGYAIVDLELGDSFINDLLNQIDDLLNKDQAKTNSSFFSYNSSPRIVDAGEKCPRVIDLALNEKIFEILRFLYKKEPIPFSTINFIKGTEQPLHSDTIHFGTMPKGYLSACWVALEDTDENNGGLCVVEGSHKLKDIDYSDLNIKPAKNMKMVEEIYREYESYVIELISELKLEKKIIPLKKGTALIWSANLLHGGSPIKDESRTRYSQVTHYNFEGCDKYFHPFFSIPSLGKYVNRNLTELDIRNYRV